MIGVLMRAKIITGTVFLMLSFAPANAETLTIGGTGAALSTMRALGEVFMQEHPDVQVAVLSSLGSGGGIRALAAGKLDIAILGRPIKSKEQVRIPKARAIQFGTTPLALVTSHKNVDAITTAQLAKILEGLTLEWPDSSQVSYILRPKKETDTILLAAYSPLLAIALEKARARPSLLMAFTDQETMDKAEKVSGALTTAAISAIISERRALKPLRLDGIVPTLENVANGTYVLIRHGYLVLRPGATVVARKFSDFVLSAKGRGILRANGYLPTKSN